MHRGTHVQWCVATQHLWAKEKIPTCCPEASAKRHVPAQCPDGSHPLSGREGQASQGEHSRYPPSGTHLPTCTLQCPGHRSQMALEEGGGKDRHEGGCSSVASLGVLSQGLWRGIMATTGTGLAGIGASLQHSWARLPRKWCCQQTVPTWAGAWRDGGGSCITALNGEVNKEKVNQATLPGVYLLHCS